MRRHGARAFEPVRIIHRGLEGKRGNRTHAGYAHELLADAVVAYDRLDLIVELQIGSIEHLPCFQ